MLKEGFIIDGIKWVIGEHPRKAVPLCPKDLIVLDPYPHEYRSEIKNAEFKCEACQKIFQLPRKCYKEKEFVLRSLDAKNYKKMKFINVDDESVPIAESKVSSKDKKFFVVSRLMKSKIGLRLVVYAGKRGKKAKTQIFVEPGVKRLSFDQNDLHPTDVFTKLEATFNDGVKASQKKKK